MAYINYKDGRQLEISDCTRERVIKRIVERDTNLFSVFCCEDEDVLFIDVDKIKDIG